MNYRLALRPTGESETLRPIHKEFELRDDDVAIEHSENLGKALMELSLPTGGICTGVQLVLESWGDHDSRPSLVKKWSIQNKKITKLGEFADRLSKISTTFLVVAELKRNLSPEQQLEMKNLPKIQLEAESEFDALCQQWIEVKKQPRSETDSLILRD